MRVSARCKSWCLLFFQSIDQDLIFSSHPHFNCLFFVFLFLFSPITIECVRSNLDCLEMEATVLRWSGNGITHSVRVHSLPFLDLVFDSLRAVNSWNSSLRSRTPQLIAFHAECVNSLGVNFLHQRTCFFLFCISFGYFCRFPASYVFSRLPL
jgi:hypothetical protein